MKRAFGYLLTFVVVAGLATAGLGYWVRRQLLEPRSVHDVEVTLEAGLGAAEILDRLESAGVIADSRLARLYLIHVLEDPSLKAGEYRFDGALDTPTVLSKLIRGEVEHHPVTLVEGWTLEETATALAEAGFGDRETLAALMQDPAPILDLDPEATNLEGYLFPDTYRFARGTPEEKIVSRLVETFRQRFEAELAPKLDSSPTAVRRMVILASIVEKEARLAEERPLIAGVYANRLRRGIALYADPTVIYALRLRGSWDGNLRKGDLQLDSPYNTYRYPGLPPGPICSPGLGSLRAAATPAEVPYLYFVSRNDGSHVFSSTLAEHNRNVRRWQKEYWQRRWAEERRAAGAGPEQD